MILIYLYSTPIYFRTIDPPKNRPKISFLSLFVLKYLHCLCAEIVLLYIVLLFIYKVKKKLNGLKRAKNDQQVPKIAEMTKNG